MKKLFLLFLATSFFSSLLIAQTTYSWRNDQNPVSGSWDVSNYWWNGSSAALPAGSEILFLDGSVGTTMTNNLGATNRYRIFFGSGGASRIINGTTENTFYDYGGTKPKIENNSSNLQTIAFPLKWGYSVCELNPVNGNLSVTSAINNNGNWTDVYGSAGTSLTIAGGISGSGGLTIKNSTTVYITSACTYTGITYVDFGTLELSADIASTSIVVASGATLRINGTAIDIQALTINSGGTVEVVAGKSLTINGALTNNGTLNLKSNSTDGTATLKVLSSVTNGGASNYNVEQYLTGSRNWYISSPISSGTMPTAGYERDEVNAEWDAVSSGAAMSVGKGYIVQPGANTTITFTGTVNNNEPTVALSRTTGQTKAGFNLIGNPYPSYYVLTKAQADASNLLYTVWYRTKEGSYTFHTFNLNGEVSSPVSVTNYIPPMQAFWVRVDSDSDGSEDFTFSNANRGHADVVSNKLKAPKVNLNKILRLDVSNGTNSDETVLYFNDEATNNYDSFDSPKMSNNSTSIPELYTLAGSEQLVINGMQSISLNTDIPLGFRTLQANSFAIKATEFSGFDSNIKAYIRDNQNLSEPEVELTLNKDYSFTSDITDDANRFSIIFRSSGTVTGLCNPLDFEKLSVFVDKNNKITVNTGAEMNNLYNIEVYNLFGQKIAQMQTKNSIETINSSFTSGVYFVKVNVNNLCATQKVIIK